MDKTLLKGLDVLTFVVCADEGVRIIDLAARFGMTKSNAYRSLKTLEHAGFVFQNPKTKEFKPTLRIWELGMTVSARVDIKKQAAPFLRQLADETHETVHLSILDGRDVLYIDKIDSIEPIAAYTKLGGRAPAHRVATGKALLSQLAPEEIEDILNNLEQHTSNSVVDTDDLLADLSKVKSQCVAINRGEWREDVWGVASPIFNLSGKAVAAVGLAGPRFRLEDSQTLNTMVERVINAAREISKSLRW